MKNLTNGLTSEEAKKRLQEYGLNKIFKQAEIKFWAIVKEEITEPIILLLFVVGFFYSLWGKLEDALTIIVVISMLVFTEIFNEYRAKKAIYSLEKISAPKTKVLRDGMEVEINTEEIVPGDILLLFPGSKISADGKIASVLSMSVDESALTGESLPVDKTIGGEVFAGTTVATGEGKVEVIKTGVRTKFGQIAQKMAIVKPPKTKLQLEMKALAGKLLYWALAVSIAIPVIGIFRGQDLKTMILTGLALSFAVIPEELPMVITMVLGLGSYNLSKKNFLIKKLKASENLGTVTCLVTDKTGTLTQGIMVPVSYYPLKEKDLLSKIIPAINPYSSNFFDKALIKSSLENKISSTGSTYRQRDMGNGKKTIAGIVKRDNSYELIVRGAPEEIFSISHVSPSVKKELEKETKKGRRVIAFASKKLKPEDVRKGFSTLEKNLTFLGLISFQDSPRPGVKETITQVYNAGIRPIMVTGDHPDTAAFIASEIGLKSNSVLTGEEIRKMSDEQLTKELLKVSVFARAEPEDKLRIVTLLQKSGEVVAVTGDGINDSLALKTADIGIAMGIKGTDVAKEAADIVLADDNYVTIVQGIFEGRKLFDNLKKGVGYYLSVKFALVFIFLIPILFGVSTPFAPIQIIVLEMFMDLAASAGFVSKPAENDIYGKFQAQIKEGVLGKKSILLISLKSTILLFTVLSVYFYSLSKGFSLIEAQTLAFSAWIFSHVFLAFVSRSERHILFSFNPFSNVIIDIWALGAVVLLLFGIYTGWLRKRLGLFPVNYWQIFVVMIFASLTANIVEIKKILKSTS